MIRNTTFSPQHSPLKYGHCWGRWLDCHLACVTQQVSTALLLQTCRTCQEVTEHLFAKHLFCAGAGKEGEKWDTDPASVAFPGVVGNRHEKKPISMQRGKEWSQELWDQRKALPLPGSGKSGHRPTCSEFPDPSEMSLEGCMKEEFQSVWV